MFRRKARVAASATLVSLTVMSDKSHFDAPGTTIPVSGLTWTATGAAFINGTMSSAGAQTVGFVDRPGEPELARRPTRLENLVELCARLILGHADLHPVHSIADKRNAPAGSFATLRRAGWWRFSMICMAS